MGNAAAGSRASSRVGAAVAAWVALGLGCAEAPPAEGERPRPSSAPSVPPSAVAADAALAGDAARADGGAEPADGDGGAEGDAGADGGESGDGGGIRIRIGSVKTQVEAPAPTAAAPPAGTKVRAPAAGSRRAAAGGKATPERGKTPPAAASRSVASAKEVSAMGTIRAHMREVEDCYGRVALKDPTIAGRITMRWTLGRDGTPTAVAVVSDTLKDKSVGACIKDRARTWRFPAPEGGLGVVTYPFDLRVM